MVPNCADGNSIWCSFLVPYQGLGCFHAHSAVPLMCKLQVLSPQYISNNPGDIICMMAVCKEQVSYIFTYWHCLIDLDPVYSNSEGCKYSFKTKYIANTTAVL